MGCFVFFFIALTSTLISLQFNLNSAQTDGNFICNFLSPSANYTAKSTFQANLNLLLSSVSNNTIRFYKETVGRNPDRIYGLSQCRGDFNSQDCHKCVQTASKRIIDNCPYKRAAVALYDECLLYYADTSFASTVQFGPTVSLYNAFNVSNQGEFASVLSELMDGLVVQAVSTASSLFAVGKRNFSASQKVYGLVQCNQDLSTSDCSKCLRMVVSVFPRCCGGRHGARVFKPSCNARYEIYEFFQSQPIIPAPVPTRTTTAANTNNTSGLRMKSLKNIVLIVAASLISTLVFSVVAIFLFLRRKKGFEIVNDTNEITIMETLQFKLATVTTATDNFSDANWLGEGGFGAVYKGKLSDGKEIAVKRLSRHSGQGVEEFKNEVRLLAKLQHRNLVRLLGFCLERNESLLIYEFVLNTSLDKFIFDPIKRTSLDWQSRYKIIRGIARGLFYLHEDSRAKIIHRDLKASNILLDAQMNPKISDFGMARLFVMDQTQGSTSRIVGTYGYMSPEYAMHGHFSVKSDVFSFGVLVLEIITGHKNNSFYESECAEDLLSYVWRQWKDGAVLEVLEPACKESCSRNEFMRCIHIGLLCVQEDIASRPTMASVDLMLNSYSVDLPLPSAPAFFVKSRFDMLPEETGTINEVSITELYPR